MDLNRKKSLAKEFILKYGIYFILILAIATRIPYTNTNQAVWWDSADYLSGAKEIGGKMNLETYDLNPKRPFLLPLLWGILYRLGANETILQLSNITLSVLVVLFTYLIGRDLYNKYVGLVASLLMSVLWMPLFFTFRFLTDIPALAFFLISLFYFWKGYINEIDKRKNILLFGLFFGLSFFTRAASLINIIPILAIILVKEKLKFFKNKNLILAVIVFLIVMSPFLIWLFATQDNAIQKFTGIGGEGERGFSVKPSHLWTNAPYITSTLFPVNTFVSRNIIGVIILLLVLVLTYDSLLGFDIMLKEKNHELMKKFFLLVWILTPYLFYSLNPGIEDRYLLAMYPAMFILFTGSIVKWVDKVKQYKRDIISVLVLLLILISVVHITTADKIIKSKADSYGPVAMAGKWINENSYRNDKVVSASKYQNMYYSERETYPFPKNEDEFESYLESIKPKYVVVSVFEPSFTPQWLYGYADKHDDVLKLAQAYTTTDNKALLAIYEYQAPDVAVA